MDRTSPYYVQVQLLVRLLPLIAEESCFALKGGTAINLFLRDMPRLSVDIDLVYLPSKQRKEALEEIKAALGRISKRVREEIDAIKITESFQVSDDALRLIVDLNGTTVKVELSPVLRGTVYDPEMMSLSPGAEEEFGFVEMKVVSLPDLYGGKICAALDRQHPRDLYDVKLLLENEGLTEKIRKAFIVYLISSPRPVSEMLRPSIKNIEAEYNNEFKKMAMKEVSLDDLLNAREVLVDLIHRELLPDEREFLLGFKNRQPDWSLLGLEGIESLAAVRWKMLNLNKMPDDRHAAAYEKLRQILVLEE